MATPPNQRPDTRSDAPTIRVNGTSRAWREGQSVRGLVEELGLGAQAVAVELNGALVRRSLHEGTLLSPGDSVELVTLVGGG